MRIELKKLLGAFWLFLLAGGLFGPIYAIFVERIGGDLLTAGGAYATFSIALGLVTLILTRWGDRIKYQERLIVLGYAIMAVAYLGYLFVTKPVHLFIVQLILGIGVAVNTPAWDAFYSKHLDKKKRISEWGVYETLLGVGNGIAALVGSAIAKTYGFRLLFWIMFNLALVGLIIATTLFINKRKN